MRRVHGTERAIISFSLEVNQLRCASSVRNSKLAFLCMILHRNGFTRQTSWFICTDDWVRIVIAREEFVDDYPFINEIDAKRAASKLPLLILEIFRRTYDGGNVVRVRAEMLLQKDELTRRRQVLPIEDCDIWHTVAAPFVISTQQRFEQRFNRRELA